MQLSANESRRNLQLGSTCPVIISSSIIRDHMRSIWVLNALHMGMLAKTFDKRNAITVALLFRSYNVYVCLCGWTRNVLLKDTLKIFKIWPSTPLILTLELRLLLSNQQSSFLYKIKFRSNDNPIVLQEFIPYQTFSGCIKKWMKLCIYGCLVNLNNCMVPRPNPYSHSLAHLWSRTLSVGLRSNSVKISEGTMYWGSTESDMDRSHHLACHKGTTYEDSYMASGSVWL